MNIQKLVMVGILCIGLIFSAHVAEAGQKVSLAITDLEGLEEVMRDWGPFRDKLQELTGLEIEFFPVNNRTAAVQAVKSKKLDMALTGPAEYVVFRAVSEAYPVAGFTRPDYHSMVCVRSDSGINSVADLKGKKVAISKIGSTSGHLGPVKILADNGIDPLKDIELVHTSREIGWESLKKGDVAAWGYGAHYLVRMRAKDEEAIAGDFKVIARGPDLPNDVLVAGPHVDAEIVNTIKDAFVNHSNELIAEILKSEENGKYTGMRFLTGVTDADYDYIRGAYIVAGYPQFADLPE